VDRTLLKKTKHYLNAPRWSVIDRVFAISYFCPEPKHITAQTTMPPKEKPSKKNVQKKKDQSIEDRTFGLKNKNKSAKVQGFIQGKPILLCIVFLVLFAFLTIRVIFYFLLDVSKAVKNSNGDPVSSSLLPLCLCYYSSTLLYFVSVICCLL
jgi:hypothetical protein